MAEIITCPECSFPIQVAKSRRVQVCKNCLSVKKTGKSFKEIAREKSRESMERSRLRSKAKQKQKERLPAALAKFSKNGKRRALQIAATKNKMKREAVDTGFGECEGCGNFFDTLDCSHTVPLSQSSELASVPGNIRLLCRGCHNAWEGNGTVAELIALRCFIPDISYLFDNDKSRFYNILGRLVNEYNLRPTQKLERVLGKIAKFEQ